MSIGRSIGVLWRGLTGGKEGLRENSKLVILDAERKAVQLGLEGEAALKVGLGEAMLNVNKLLPFASKDSHDALEEVSIFLSLPHDEAIERLLDYLIWKQYKDERARERLENALPSLIEEMIDKGAFDPIRESSSPTFAWSSFVPRAVVRKALDDFEKRKLRTPWQKTVAERQASAQELRDMAAEWYEESKNHIIVQNKPADKVHIYCVQRTIHGGWEYMLRKFGRHAVGYGDYFTTSELEPFLRLDTEQGRKVAIEYVIWRLYPDQADQAAIKAAVLAYIDAVKEARSDLVDLQPGEGDAYWMDLINGDRLARPWGNPSEWS